MDAADAVLWLSLVFNVGLTAALITYFRSIVKAGALTERKAKAIYSFLCLATGAFCGIALFLGVTAMFEISLGHGEIIFAAPLFNLALSCVLIVAGRIVIGWVPIKW